MVKDLDYKYSIDMIRIRRNIPKRMLQRMDKFNINPNVEYYMNTDFKAYKYNWSIKTTNNGSFYVGAGLNLKGAFEKRNQVEVVVEFNPNKTKNNEMLKEVLYLFFQEGMSYNLTPIEQKKLDDHIEVMSVDVAVDLIDVNINQLYFTAGDKTSYKIFKYPGKGNKTIYLGSRKRDQIKIYNKAQEQGLTKEKGFDEFDWTRYELSIKLESPDEYEKKYYNTGNINKFKYEKNIPNIIYNPMSADKIKNMSNTDKCLIKGFMANAFQLSELGRRKKKKIKSALDQQTLEIDKNKITRKIVQFVKNYYSIMEVEK